MATTSLIIGQHMVSRSDKIALLPLSWWSWSFGLDDILEEINSCLVCIDTTTNVWQKILWGALKCYALHIETISETQSKFERLIEVYSKCISLNQTLKLMFIGVAKESYSEDCYKNFRK